MTVTSEEGRTNLPNDRLQLGRTFAMTLASAGYGTMTAGFAYLFSLFLGAADDPDAAAAIPILITMAAIVAVIGGVTVWSGRDATLCFG